MLGAVKIKMLTLHFESPSIYWSRKVTPTCRILPNKIPKKLYDT